jgi:UDP-N-acetylmuramyl pentapeptide phosphotransferase/UDP-N-acetylglucosamine-1-phosphate transferase
MYREKYAKSTAINLFRQGKPLTEVVQMLVVEGASPEQATPLAHKYYQTYALLRVEDSKRKRKQAGMFKTIGLVFTLGSLVLSILSYLLIDDGGSFIGYYGVLGFGLLLWLKGVLDTRAAATELQQAQQATTAMPT